MNTLFEMTGSKVRDNLHKAVSLISSKRELKKGEVGTR